MRGGVPDALQFRHRLALGVAGASGGGGVFGGVLFVGLVGHKTVKVDGQHTPVRDRYQLKTPVAVHRRKERQSGGEGSRTPVLTTFCLNIYMRIR